MLLTTCLILSYLRSVFLVTFENFSLGMTFSGLCLSSSPASYSSFSSGTTLTSDLSGPTILSFLPSFALVNHLLFLALSCTTEPAHTRVLSVLDQDSSGRFARPIDCTACFVVHHTPI